MNANDIESFSTIEISRLINSSDYLFVIINQNDKEPCWDGNIYVYNKKGKRKENLVGKIPIQVKGKKSLDLTKGSIKYPIQIIDLQNYLSEGIAYFVVLIHPDTHLVMPYFVLLQPMKIDKILKKHKTQKQISVKLTPIPNNTHDLASMLLNFYDHCKKQKSYVGLPLPSLNDLESKGLLRGITTTISGFKPLPSDPIQFLISDDVTFYAETEGNPSPLPLDMEFNFVQVVFGKDTSISIGEKQFYDQVEIVKTKDQSKIIIGKSLVITIDSKLKKTKVDYIPQNFIRARLFDNLFLLEAIRNGGFTIGGTHFDLHITQGSQKGEKDLDESTKRDQRIVSILNELHLEGDLDMSTITSEELQLLKVLEIALLEKEPVSLNTKYPESLIHSKLGPYSLLLAVLPKQNSDETYRVFDYANEYSPCGYSLNDENNRPMSQYAFLAVEDLVEVSNLPFDKIFPSFQTFSDDPNIILLASQFTFRLLNAYDKSNKERQREIGKTLSEFSKWIVELSKDKPTLDFARMLQLQVVIRTQTLSSEDLLYLEKVAKEGSFVDRATALVLIGRFEEANSIVSQMNENEKNEWEIYPVSQQLKK